jgi:hypothetical protein
MENWVKVFKSTNAIEAEMVKDMLQENDIEAVVINKIDRSLNFGEASVWVFIDNEQVAKGFIQSNLINNYE